MIHHFECVFIWSVYFPIPEMSLLIMLYYQHVNTLCVSFMSIIYCKAMVTWGKSCVKKPQIHFGIAIRMASPSQISLVHMSRWAIADVEWIGIRETSSSTSFPTTAHCATRILGVITSERAQRVISYLREKSEYSRPGPTRPHHAL